MHALASLTSPTYLFGKVVVVKVVCNESSPCLLLEAAAVFIQQFGCLYGKFVVTDQFHPEKLE